jgi:cupin domain
VGLYVLSGRLRPVLGEHDIVLPAGEAAEFDTRVPHRFGSADGRAVELLGIFGHRGSACMSAPVPVRRGFRCGSWWHEA